MEWIEEEGKTKEEAVDRALSRLGLTLREVEVEVLGEGKKLLNFLGAKSVRIRVHYHPSTPELTEAKQTTEQLFNLMHVRADVVGRIEDEIIYLEADSDSSGLLIGRRGQTLDAIQFLLKRMLNRHLERRFKLVLDIQNYRKKQAVHINRLAQQVAEKVISIGQSVSGPPMNPHDRRLFHIALRDHPHVQTASQGEGFLRSIVVSPKDEWA